MGRKLDHARVNRQRAAEDRGPGDDLAARLRAFNAHYRTDFAHSDIQQTLVQQGRSCRDCKNRLGRAGYSMVLRDSPFSTIRKWIALICPSCTDQRTRARARTRPVNPAPRAGRLGPTKRVQGEPEELRRKQSEISTGADSGTGDPAVL